MSTTTSTTNKTAYMGIADAHGIESFVCSEKAEDSTRGLLHARAACNRQRHAVFFEVVLSDEQVAEVQKEIDDGDWEAALYALKRVASEAGEISLAGGGNEMGSFDLIPNKKLDPWG